MSALTLVDAKAHLNITGTQFDTKLQATIDAAEAAIAAKVGPLEPLSVTERVRGGGTALVLREMPLIALTSVTSADSEVIDAGDMYPNTASGLVEMNDGSTFGSRYYTVVYNAGRADLPADLLEAVKELVRHLWQSAQRGGRPNSAPSDATANSIPGAAYLFPFRVEQLLAPHLLPGFA